MAEILGIPLWFMVVSGGGILILLGLVGILLWRLTNLKNFMLEVVNAVLEAGMSREDFIEQIQREFIILLKDDKLFRKHIEKRVMANELCKKNI